MGGIFKDDQIIVMGNKTNLDFHTPGWMSMIVDMTPLGGRDMKFFSRWVCLKCTVNEIKKDDFHGNRQASENNNMCSKYFEAEFMIFKIKISKVKSF